MAKGKIYPTGPIKHLLKQMYGLQRFKDQRRCWFKELTKRETEVLVLIANGMKNPAIAKKLGISRVTVQNHRSRIREKLGIKDQADFIKYALAYDLIQF